MSNLFTRKKNQKGQGLFEYTLILVFSAIVVVGVLTLLGPQVSDAFAKVETALGGPAHIDDLAYEFTEVGIGQAECESNFEHYGTIWGTGSEGLGCYFPIGEG